MSSMSVDESLAGPRERLVEAALQALEEGGPEALQARKLAAQIGTSTMAVYTHFGGMPELFDALVTEGFVRFGERMAEVPKTDDPVTDFAALGLSYRDYALKHPQRYRLMFGLAGPGVPRKDSQDLTEEGSPTRLPEGAATFETLVSAVQRVIDSGSIHDADAVTLAGQMWSATHGYVLLEITGVFGPPEHGLAQILGPMMVNQLVGLGADRESVRKSMLAAFAARVDG
jgi:AcrR family transcriptional regulator